MALHGYHMARPNNFYQVNSPSIVSGNFYHMSAAQQSNRLMRTRFQLHYQHRNNFRRHFSQMENTERSDHLWKYALRSASRYTFNEYITLRIDNWNRTMRTRTHGLVCNTLSTMCSRWITIFLSLLFIFTPGKVGIMYEYCRYSQAINHIL